MTRVLGVDPGPAERYGRCLLTVNAGGLAWSIPEHDELEQLLATVDLVAVERFIIGAGTARRTRGATAPTIACVEMVRDVTHRAGVRLVELPAGIVKPWATNDRLALWSCPVKGDHHKDAARHALYAAVRCGILPRRPR